VPIGRRLVPIAVVVLATISGGCARRRSGPNDAYQDPRVAAETWRELFEGNDREIYRQRDLIMKLAALKAGMTVMDVGAGTGLFAMRLSDAVGQTGRVYAEEILPQFSTFIAERAMQERRNNVISVVGTETSVGLPPDSVDFVFACECPSARAHPDRRRTALAAGRDSRACAQGHRWMLT
jgi:hypothetical protein